MHADVLKKFAKPFRTFGRGCRASEPCHTPFRVEVRNLREEKDTRTQEAPVAPDLSSCLHRLASGLRDAPRSVRRGWTETLGLMPGVPPKHHPQRTLSSYVRQWSNGSSRCFYAHVN